MNITRVAGLIRQVGQALTAAYEEGIWHPQLGLFGILRPAFYAGCAVLDETGAGLNCRFTRFIGYRDHSVHGILSHADIHWPGVSRCG